MAIIAGRFRHLTIFSICLGVLLLALGIFLFAVKIEHFATGKGLLRSRSVVRIAINGDAPFEPGMGLSREQLEAVCPQFKATGKYWLLLELKEGQAKLLPVRDESGSLLEAIVEAEFDEKQFGELEIGQKVRLKSAMFSPRTHGYGEGKIVALRPIARENSHGQRGFGVEIAVTTAPFPLFYGSSIEAEVFLGRKETFRVILEH
jgi:hypothetical protein